MDKYLIILGAGPQQEYVYLKCKELGIKTVALDQNPKAASICFADIFVQASIKDSQECISALSKQNLQYSGVMTYGAEVSQVVSDIANRFNLISVSTDVAYATTNKGRRSEILRAAGIRIPKYEILSKFQEPNFSFPCIVKPTDSSGSRGVTLVNNKDSWKSAFDLAASISSDQKVIVEEYLNGQEISIEGFVLNNKVYIYGLTDRNFLPVEETDMMFIEDGSSGPSKFDFKIIDEVKSEFAKAVIALGIKNGPTKGDLIVTENGVFVFEITSRLSPGFSMFSEEIYGVSPLDQAIKYATGQKVYPEDLVPKFNHGFSHRYYFHQPGKIKSITGFQSVSESEGVIKVVKLSEFKEGDILDPVTNLNRLFYVFTKGKDREEAVILSEKAIKKVKIELEG